MGDVIHLDAYRFNDGEEDMRYEWKGSDFRTVDGLYFDRATSPPFPVHHITTPLRQDIIDRIPKRVSNTTFQPEATEVFMPFSLDAEPFWAIGVESGFLNNFYAPYTMLLYVLRDHPKALFDMVSGEMVEDEAAYIRIQNSFNNLYTRLLKHQGSGRNGDASEDEMVRAGVLFYKLLQTCSNHEGLVVDNDGNFMNVWGGEKKILNPKLKELQTYASKLKHCCVSGLDWNVFFHRYIWRSNENSLWFFNIPAVKRHKRTQYDFTIEDMYVLLGDYIPMLTSKGAKVLCLIPVEEKLRDRVVNHFDMKQSHYDLESYSGSGIHMLSNVMTHNGSESFIMVSNYEFPYVAKQMEM